MSTVEKCEEAIEELLTHHLKVQNEIVELKERVGRLERWKSTFSLLGPETQEGEEEAVVWEMTTAEQTLVLEALDLFIGHCDSRYTQSRLHNWWRDNGRKLRAIVTEIQ